MRPIVGRDLLELLAQVEAEYGKTTADALAEVMRSQAQAELAELEARRDELVTAYPELKARGPRRKD